MDSLVQLSEGRLRTTVDNIAGKRLEKAKDQTEIGKAFEDAYKDLGYKTKIIYTDPSNAPQLIDEKGNIKGGTAYVGADGIHTIIINVEDPKNSTRSGIIGTISEEGSHIIGKVEGRQLQTGTEEKGLESTGRATNEYFTDKYKKNDIPIEAKSDGKDYSNVDFGENVGDRFVLQNAPYVKQYIFPKNLKNEGGKYPVLYVDEEYPKEYNRLMKLPRVIDGFEKNLFSIETDLVNLISKKI